MSNYNYYGDFYEPSEFDMMVKKWKDELRKSVKKEYVDEMARLREENDKLRWVKYNWDAEIAKLESEKSKYQQMTRDVKKMQLNGRIIFLDAEDAQKYCDWRNAEERKKAGVE